MAMRSLRKQVNIRLEPSLYRTLARIARQERRSIPQLAGLLMEEGLARRANVRGSVETAPGTEIARLATAGGAFDWLGEEAELYDDTSGEPV